MSYPLEYGSYWFVYAYMMSGEHRIGIIQVVHLYLYYVLSLGIRFVLVCLCVYDEWEAIIQIVHLYLYYVLSLGI